MSRSCPHCQSAVSPKSRFCPSCGTTLAALTEQSPTEELRRTVQTETAHVSSDASDTATTEVLATQIAGGATNPRQPIAAVVDRESSRERLRSQQTPATSDDARAPHEPASVWLNFSRVLIAGHASMFELRFSNHEPVALENVELVFESRGLSAPIIVAWRRVVPGAKIQRIVEIDPARPGNFVLQIGVTWDTGGQRVAYRGQRPLRINQSPDASNIVINIGDIQCNAGGGANANLGAEYGDVHISNLLGGNSIKTLNDLLDLELPEKFQRVPLSLDYELSMAAVRETTAGSARALTIPPTLLATAKPAKVCGLEPADGVEQLLPLRLVARDTFKVGRSRADADFVAWLLPRGEANDERTLRVSKVHAIAQLRPDGFRLRDNNSANGTLLDGQRLGAEEPGLPLVSRARVGLGGGVELDVTCFDSDRPSAPEIRNLRHWAGPTAPAPWKRGAVRWEVAADQPHPLNSLWLLTDASFGASHSNPLVFAWPGVDEIQGRFHHFNGCFWIENASPAGAVLVDNIALKVGEIAPLASGQRLQIGSRIFRVAVSE